jgi:hypothetical protein
VSRIADGGVLFILNKIAEGGVLLLVNKLKFFSIFTVCIKETRCFDIRPHRKTKTLPLLPSPPTKKTVPENITIQSVNGQLKRISGFLRRY